MTKKGTLCPLCACSRVDFRCRVNGVDLVRCDGCGLVFVQPMPSDEELRRLYQEDYFQSPDHLHWGYENYFRQEEEVRRMARYRLQVVRRYLDGGRLLDSGCATGWFLDEARRQGFAVQGVEVCERAAAWGRERLDLPVFTGTLAEAAFDDATFDGVTLWNVFEHLADPFGELEELGRVLKRNGYLFVTVPNQGSLLARLMDKRWFGYSKAREHLYFFDRRTLALALDRAGFDTVHVQRSPYTVSIEFLADKLGQYSGRGAALLRRLARGLGVGDRKIDVSLVDILAVARKR